MSPDDRGTPGERRKRQPYIQYEIPRTLRRTIGPVKRTIDLVATANVTVRPLSERRRRVDPQQHGFFVRRVVPAMADGALEPETIACVQRVAFQVVEPDLQRS